MPRLPHCKNLPLLPWSPLIQRTHRSRKFMKYKIAGYTIIFVLTNLNLLTPLACASIVIADIKHIRYQPGIATPQDEHRTEK
jgi:hypothetical protein